jgi:anhydro-N-acetylmuramic acid kinase
MQHTYKVIGLMSGTSLDGLDIAYCQFEPSMAKWKFELLIGETISYNQERQKALIDAKNLNALKYAKLNVELGEFFGTEVKNFCEKHQIKPDFIASHGHTVFHQPNSGLTTQIGNAAAIAAITKIPTIADFRTTDVALGGQGAPLVPIGDEILFSEYDFCLNLGGIANISYANEQKRLAFDICPVNMVLNRLANLLGKDYDEGGSLARSGKLHQDLMDRLNKMTFYQNTLPKSIGLEWVTKYIMPTFKKFDISVEDQLCTFTHHIAMQIAKIIAHKPDSSLLITGGGAFNTFLVEQIAHYGGEKLKVIIPDQKIIDFKEAIIFAFLGVLRWRQKNNTLKSVTGARRDSCGGAIYWY